MTNHDAPSAISPPVAMERLEFECPKCHGKIMGPASLADQVFPCPKCHAVIQEWPIALTDEPFESPSALTEPAESLPIHAFANVKAWCLRNRWLSIAIASVALLLIVAVIIDLSSARRGGAGGIFSVKARGEIQGVYDADRTWYQFVSNEERAESQYKGMKMTIDGIVQRIDASEVTFRSMKLDIGPATESIDQSYDRMQSATFDNRKPGSIARFTGGERAKLKSLTVGTYVRINCICAGAIHTSQGDKGILVVFENCEIIPIKNGPGK